VADWDFWATLRTVSPRYADWLKVFGPEAVLGVSGVKVPITTPIPERVVLPIGTREVFFIKLDLLSGDQRGRLVQHLSERFHIPAAEVEQDFRDRPGREAPVLNEDLFVAVFHPQKWFS
jgi:hypothetical protein